VKLNVGVTFDIINDLFSKAQKLMSISQIEYQRWFQDYVDRFGINKENGRLGLLFCAAFDIQNVTLREETDDRAAIIAIHQYTEYHMTVNDEKEKHWLTDEKRKKYQSHIE
jgi:hypothetical protein